MARPPLRHGLEEVKIPRNSSGTYTLPVGAFSPGGLIKSGDHNANYSDIATALTQSVATTGVSSMTGPLKAAAGSQSAPSYAFSSDPTTGLYLAGTHQIGVTTNGTAAFFVNSDQSTTWQGNATWGAATTVTINGALTVAGTVNLNSTNYVFGAGAANAFWTGLSPNIGIEMFVDGGGSVIAAGVHGYVEVPFACTVNAWTIVSTPGGGSNGINFDVWRANGAVPTSSAQSIIGGGGIATGSGATYAHSTPSGWVSTALAKGDILAIDVASATGCTQALLSLNVTRTGN